MAWSVGQTLPNSEVPGLRAMSRGEAEKTAVRSADWKCFSGNGKLWESLGSTPEVEAGVSGLPGQPCICETLTYSPSPNKITTKPSQQNKIPHNK